MEIQYKLYEELCPQAQNRKILKVFSPKRPLDDHGVVTQKSGVTNSIQYKQRSRKCNLESVLQQKILLTCK